ncbi:MAG: CBS domain-containing protein [Anaerolineae bacterium]
MSQILPEAAKKRVGDVMTTQVITVSPTTQVGEIARLMSQHNIGGLPVVDDGEVIGVVTELDLIVRNTRFKMPAFFTILDMIIYLETPKHYEERLEHILGTTAEEIMSKPAKTVAPTATIEDLAELMIGRRMNPIPVVENGRLVGIVSRSDIVRLMAQEFETKPAE